MEILAYLLLFATYSYLVCKHIVNTFAFISYSLNCWIKSHSYHLQELMELYILHIIAAAAIVEEQLDSTGAAGGTASDMVFSQVVLTMFSIPWQ